MPKSRRPKESSSDSDSGPDDPTPAKKSKSSGGAAKAKGNPAVEGDEPTWDLGKMKKVKVCLESVSNSLPSSSVLDPTLYSRLIALLSGVPKTENVLYPLVGSPVQGDHLHRHPRVVRRQEHYGHEAREEGNIAEL